MNNTVILLSSSRDNGNTSALVDAVSDLCEVDVFKLNEYNISPFDYEHKNIDDDFVPLVEELLRYQHIIFASPVYWYSMSAQLKAFVDRISDLLHVKKELGRKLRSKTCSVFATGASPQPERSFEETFINSFEYLGMEYNGMLYCYCENGFVLEHHMLNIESFLK